MDLSGEWRFRPDGGDETKIAVPAFWETQGFLTLDGRATYEREVVLDVEAPHATLEFDAVADLCDVFVNGQHVGSHEGGFTPFALEASGLLDRGPNTLRVEVIDPALGSEDWRRTPQGKQGWGNRPFPSPPSVYITYGGIWQPCRLITHGPAFITDLACDMDPDRPKVTVEVRGDYDEIEVRAFGHALRGRARTYEFDGSHEPWSPTDPVLHRIEATVFCDNAASHKRTIATGLRRIEQSGDEILLNGEKVRIRSALHQGFWPRGLYAADDELIERDIDLALAAGLNSLRTHLKPFEPSWLDVADAKGLLIQSDMPISEPLRDPDLCGDETFVRRCITAVTEQVRRDRSRPSIILWAFTNEVGLVTPEILESEAYRSLIAKLADAVRELDPARPFIENDWVYRPNQLVTSNIRSPHWYGRADVSFMRFVSKQLEETAHDAVPLLVNEFGEWGVPSPEGGEEFWDTDRPFAELTAEAGWPGDHRSLAEGSQQAQGWAGRIQAERLRTAPHVKGFCITEWTDVPHEYNGLVTLRRNPKLAVDAFRPALADVAPIATLDRFTFAEGEEAAMHLFLSNWSNEDLGARELAVSLGRASTQLDVPPVPAGGVVDAGPCALIAETGELTLRYGDVVATYPLTVCRPAESQRVRVADSPELRDALTAAGWDTSGGPEIAIGEPPQGGGVLLEPTSVPSDWPGLVEVPTRWGPTPVPFTTTGMRAFPPDTVLAHEVFACYPRRMIPGVQGPVGMLIPPPIRRWGALVAQADGFVVCTLSIVDALLAGEAFALAVLADLVRLARRGLASNTDGA